MGGNHTIVKVKQGFVGKARPSGEEGTHIFLEPGTHQWKRGTLELEEFIDLSANVINADGLVSVTPVPATIDFDKPSYAVSESCKAAEAPSESATMAEEPIASELSAEGEAAEAAEAAEDPVLSQHGLCSQ